MGGSTGSCCLSINPASSYAEADVEPVCSALFFCLGPGSLSELQRDPQDQRGFSPQDEKSPDQPRCQKVLLHLPCTRAKNYRFKVTSVINHYVFSLLLSETNENKSHQFLVIA